MRTHTQQYAQSEHHTKLANMSFDDIFDLTASVFVFFIIYATVTILWTIDSIACQKGSLGYLS